MKDNNGEKGEGGNDDDRDDYIYMGNNMDQENKIGSGDEGEGGNDNNRDSDIHVGDNIDQANKISSGDEDEDGGSNNNMGRRNISGNRNGFGDNDELGESNNEGRRMKRKIWYSDNEPATTRAKRTKMISGSEGGQAAIRSTKKALPKGGNNYCIDEFFFCI